MEAEYTGSSWVTWTTWTGFFSFYLPLAASSISSRAIFSQPAMYASKIIHWVASTEKTDLIGGSVLIPLVRMGRLKVYEERSW